jgi:hypothetical protein
MQIPRTVSKYGDSWVIKLDKQTRDILGITAVGQTVMLNSTTSTTQENAHNDISNY